MTEVTSRPFIAIMPLLALAFFCALFSEIGDVYSADAKASSSIQARAKFIEAAGVNISSMTSIYAASPEPTTVMKATMFVSIQGARGQSVAVSYNLANRDKGVSSKESVTRHLFLETRKIVKDVLLPLDDLTSFENPPSFVIDVSYL
jgi:hypothetical protein